MKPLSLLSLPYELRVAIYDLLLAKNAIHVDAKEACACPACSSFPSHIIATCRTCRDEARPILYSSTTFIFQSIVRAASFFSSPYYAEGVRYIKSIIVGFDADREVFEISGAEPVRAFLAASSNLFGNKGLLATALTSLEHITIQPLESWNLKINAKEDSEALSDKNILRKVHGEVVAMTGLRSLLADAGRAASRKYDISLVISLQYLRPGKVIPYRFQNKLVRVDLDNNTIDREYKGVSFQFLRWPE